MSPKATVQGSWVRDVQLTTRAARAIKAPARGQTFYFDAEKKELALRVLPSGAKAWVVNLTHDGRLYRRVLKPLTRCTAEEARKEADIAIGQIKAGEGKYALGREERRAQREQTERATRARRDEKSQTLRRLCELYVEDLEKRGRSSARDAASLFKCHVYERPEALRPARDLEAEDIAAILRSVVKAKHGRTAAKLRSYLRAAYQRAAVARADPAADEELGVMAGLGVKVNPVAAVASLSQFNKPRNRAALSEEELGTILARLSSDSSLPARAAWVGMLLGGQRPAQLMRAKVAHLNGALTLYDGKGRRQTPREHLVPVIGEAATTLNALAKQAKERRSEWIFSTHGKVPLRTETVNDVVVQISDSLAKEAKKQKRPFEPFSLRDLRAAVETQLASLGVTKEVRAHLLSHGVRGVQDTHYNKYDFLKEKTEALELWHARIAKLIKEAA